MKLYMNIKFVKDETPHSVVGDPDRECPRDNAQRMLYQENNPKPRKPMRPSFQ